MSDTYNLLDSSPGDWTLLGAGRANAVFAFTGDRADLASKVLRLSKPRAKARPRHALDLESAVWAGYPELLQTDPVRRAYSYVHRMLSPMLDRRYIVEQAFAYVTPELVRTLLSAIGQKSDDTNPCTALLLPNVTRFAAPTSAPTLCVELKPKWGCLPTAAAIHPDNDAKRRVSKFQLQQHLKLAQGKVTRLSGYDPLDLFSGEPARVAEALRTMLDVPQNNLRLFRDGAVMTFSGLKEAGGSSQLAAALDGWSAQPSDQSAALVAALQQVLQQEGVLANLLQMQRLDQHDIEGVHLLYQALLQRKCQPQERQPQAALSPGQQTPPPLPQQQLPAATSRSPPTAAPAASGGEAAASPRSPMSPAREQLPYADCGRRHCAVAERMTGFLFIELLVEALVGCQAARDQLLALPPHDAHAVLRAYMVAATAKDCSVMVTLRRVPDGGRAVGSIGSGSDTQGTVTVGTPPQSFEYKVAAVDLDFKPLEKIEEHFELDTAIMHQCRQRCLPTV